MNYLNFEHYVMSLNTKKDYPNLVHQVKTSLGFNLLNREFIPN